MAITSNAQALSQYAEACADGGWEASDSKAALALEAIRYLLVNRIKSMEDVGSKIDYESLSGEKSSIESFLGSTSPRANGRSRFVPPHYGRGAIK